MGRWLVIFGLVIGVLLVIGLYVAFSGEKDWQVESSSTAIVVREIETGKFRELIEDMGWEKAKSVRMANGSILPKFLIKRVVLIYTAEPQQYFVQTAFEGSPVFASMDSKWRWGDLQLIVHADPLMLAGEADENKRQWLVTHQVIRMTNFMLHPELDETGLMDLDAEMFIRFGDAPYFDVATT